MQKKTERLVRGSLELMREAGAFSNEEFEQLSKKFEKCDGDKILVTREEAGAMLSVSPMTIIRLQRTGTLPTVRVSSGTVRIPIDAVRDLASKGVKARAGR